MIDPATNMVRPFADTALELYQYGLAVIPVGSDDGKRPMVEWGKWKRPPGRDFLTKLTTRFKTDMERLRDLAAWFDYAAMWLSREVSDSRGDDGHDLDGLESNQVVEQVAFIKSELDELLVGFHTASAMLTAIVEPPVPDNTGRMQGKARSAVPYLRVIDGGSGL